MLIGEEKNKARVLADVCSKLSCNALNDAIAILRNEYPFIPFQNAGRSWTPQQSLQIFFRDGFIDRYSGSRLVFPGSLRILSECLPVEFPFHPNWKTDQCHFAYWEMLPTIDHVIPVSRGGADDETNWVTTSMVKNAAKANFLLDEINWLLLPNTASKDWDGLTSWFSKEIAAKPILLQNAYIRRWSDALTKITCSASIRLNDPLE